MWTECKQPGPHWHGTHTCVRLGPVVTDKGLVEVYVVPVGEGTIIEIRDGLRDEIANFLREMGLDIACFAAADGVMERLRAAAGEKP